MHVAKRLEQTKLLLIEKKAARLLSGSRMHEYFFSNCNQARNLLINYLFSVLLICNYQSITKRFNYKSKCQSSADSTGKIDDFDVYEHFHKTPLQLHNANFANLTLKSITCTLCQNYKTHKNLATPRRQPNFTLHLPWLIFVSTRRW